MRMFFPSGPSTNFARHKSARAVPVAPCWEMSRRLAGVERPFADAGLVGGARVIHVVGVRRQLGERDGAVVHTDVVHFADEWKSRAPTIRPETDRPFARSTGGSFLLATTPEAASPVMIGPKSGKAALPSRGRGLGASAVTSMRVSRGTLPVVPPSTREAVS